MQSVGPEVLETCEVGRNGGREGGDREGRGEEEEWGTERGIEWRGNGEERSVGLEGEGSREDGAALPLDLATQLSMPLPFAGSSQRSHEAFPWLHFPFTFLKKKSALPGGWVPQQQMMEQPRHQGHTL